MVCGLPGLWGRTKDPLEDRMRADGDRLGEGLPGRLPPPPLPKLASPVASGPRCKPPRRMAAVLSGPGGRCSTAELAAAGGGSGAPGTATAAAAAATASAADGRGDIEEEVCCGGTAVAAAAAALALRGRCRGEVSGGCGSRTGASRRCGGGATPPAASCVGVGSGDEDVRDGCWPTQVAGSFDRGPSGGGGAYWSDAGAAPALCCRAGGDGWAEDGDACGLRGSAASTSASASALPRMLLAGSLVVGATPTLKDTLLGNRPPAPAAAAAGPDDAESGRRRLARAPTPIPTPAAAGAAKMLPPSLSRV